jgi:TonB family protein
MAKVRLVSAAVIAAAIWAGGLGAGTVPAHAAEVPEPSVGGPGAEGDYLRLVHERVHPGWVDGFIRISPYKQLGPASSDRQAEVSITIRWDGTVENAEVTRSSGSLEFDAAALNSIWFAAPFPPPVDVLADDGLAHVKWRFARNYRLCSGGEIVHVEFPIQIALPNLALRGQFAEALRRMGDELSRQGWTGEDFVSPFARQWLGRPNLSNDLDTRAAAALAMAGDRQQVHFLETALLLPQTAAIAAPALQQLGVDVGAILAKALAGDPTASKHSAVVAAVRATPAAASGCPACVLALAASALDPRQPSRARVDMIEILGHLDRSQVVAQALAHAAKDSNPALRGAALLALMPPHRGRVGVIRLAPLLHDPAPEIRAAAAAGVLRAGGDLGIEQLFLLGRERDPRPLIAAASELGHMSTEASTALLGKLLKRSEKNVRLAAIRALAGRADAPARALVDPILAAARANSSEDPAIRELAISSADPAELVGISIDTRIGAAAYRALLRANLRQEAARWLIGNLERLSPEDRITALGDWIAEAPKYSARK